MRNRVCAFLSSLLLFALVGCSAMSKVNNRQEKKSVNYTYFTINQQKYLGISSDSNYINKLSIDCDSSIANNLNILNEREIIKLGIRVHELSKYKGDQAIMIEVENVIDSSGRVLLVRIIETSLILEEKDALAIQMKFLNTLIQPSETPCICVPLKLEVSDKIRSTGRF